MFSCFAGHFRLSGLKFWEYLDRIAGVEMELTTLGAILRTVRHGVVDCQAPDDLNRV